MADIDKSLTEIRKSVEIPGPEEQAEVTEEIKESLPDAGETEITPTEDGGVEINFEPGAFNQAQSTEQANDKIMFLHVAIVYARLSRHPVAFIKPAKL